MKKRNGEYGSHHIVLVVGAVVALAGVLGFVGYNAWQKQSSDAGGASTIGTRATAKPSKTIKGSGFNMRMANARVASDGKVADTIKLPHYVPASLKQSNTWIKKKDKRSLTSSVSMQYGRNGESDKTKQDTSFNKFINSNLGKKIEVCAKARVTATRNAPKLELSVWGTKNASKYKRFNLTTKYKEYCMITPINKSSLNVTSDFLRFDINDVGGHSFGTSDFSIYISRLKFTAL